MREITAAAPTRPTQRAEVVSAYPLVCYTGNSLPVIGVGLLSRAVSPVMAHAAFAALLAVLSILACVGWRYAPQAGSSGRTR